MLRITLKLIRKSANTCNRIQTHKKTHSTTSQIIQQHSKTFKTGLEPYFSNFLKRSPAVSQLAQTFSHVFQLSWKLWPLKTIIQKTLGTPGWKVLHFYTSNSSRGRMRAEWWRSELSLTFSNFLQRSQSYPNFLTLSLTLSNPLSRTSSNFLELPRTFSNFLHDRYSEDHSECSE